MSNYYRSPFLEHPLCKELDIASLVLAKTTKSKGRSLERRSAMDLITSTPVTILSHPREEEADFQTRKKTSHREYAKNEAYFKNGRRPCLPKISSVLMDNDGGTSSISHSCRGRTYRESSGLQSILSTINHSNIRSSSLPREDLAVTGTATNILGPENRDDNFLNLFDEYKKRFEIMTAQRRISPLEIRVKTDRFDDDAGSFFNRAKPSGMEFDCHSPSSTISSSKPLEPSPFAPKLVPGLPLSRSMLTQPIAVTCNVSNAKFQSDVALTNMQKEIYETPTMNVIKPCDTHDVAALLTSIRNLIHKEDTSDPVSVMPKLPSFKKHSKRDNDKMEVQHIRASLSLARTRIRAVANDTHSTIDSSQCSAASIHVDMDKEDNRSKPCADALPPSLPPFPKLEVMGGTRSPRCRRGLALRKRQPLEDCSNFFLIDTDDENSSEDKDAHGRSSKSKSQTSVVKRPKPRVTTASVRSQEIDNHESKTTPSTTYTRVSTITAMNTTTTPGMSKFILRKSFSWKSYPELEAFLIENRDEYFQHSALNYTMEQKLYNNRLTGRMIVIAKSCGYVFDPDFFTFSKIRDRIRCYFKTYVQSLKKRA